MEMALNFTAIDFETANRRRASACAVGIAVVDDGKIARVDSTLVRPPILEFEGINVGIHGITETMVVDAPEFNQLWEAWILPAIPSGTIVAHNASFDTSVLRGSFCAYEMPCPDLDYYCTRVLAKNHLSDFVSYDLQSVAQAYDVKLTNHHDPMEDARAAAEIAIALCEELGVDDLEAASRKLKINPGKMWDRGWRSCGKGKAVCKYDPLELKAKAGLSVEKPVAKLHSPSALDPILNLDSINLAELSGLVQGVLADDRLVYSEATYLQEWFNKAQTAGLTEPNQIRPFLALLDEVLKDGELDESEERRLMQALGGKPR